MSTRDDVSSNHSSNYISSDHDDSDNNLTTHVQSTDDKDNFSTRDDVSSNHSSNYLTSDHGDYDELYEHYRADEEQSNRSQDGISDNDSSDNMFGDIPHEVISEMCCKKENKVASRKERKYREIKAPPSQDCYIYIDSRKWDKLRRHQNGHKLPADWVNVFSKPLKKIHPFCSLQFRRHYVSAKTTRRTSTFAFSANGYCNFSGCNVTFKIKMNDEINYS